MIRGEPLGLLRAASIPGLALVAGSMHAWAIALPVGGQPVWWLQLGPVNTSEVHQRRGRS